MSSTDFDAQQAKALAAFYQRHLAPLRVPAAAGAQGSSYVTRTATRMTRADFELAMADEAQIIRTLRARWKATPLQSIPEPLLKLARQFERSEQQAQVSAFVYEMF